MGLLTKVKSNQWSGPKYRINSVARGGRVAKTVPITITGRTTTHKVSRSQIHATESTELIRYCIFLRVFSSLNSCTTSGRDHFVSNCKLLVLVNSQSALPCLSDDYQQAVIDNQVGSDTGRVGGVVFTNEIRSDLHHFLLLSVRRRPRTLEGENRFPSGTEQ